MIINNLEKSKVRFGDFTIGDTFIFADRLLMKIPLVEDDQNGLYYNTVSLSTEFDILAMRDNSMVIPCSIHMEVSI